MDENPALLVNQLKRFEELGKVLKNLKHPRTEILEIISEKPNCMATQIRRWLEMKYNISISLSAVLKHLKKLEEAKLIKKILGKSYYPRNPRYSINQEKTKEVLITIRRLIENKIASSGEAVSSIFEILSKYYERAIEASKLEYIKKHLKKSSPSQIVDLSTTRINKNKIVIYWKEYIPREIHSEFLIDVKGEVSLCGGCEHICRENFKKLPQGKNTQLEEEDIGLYNNSYGRSFTLFH